MRKDTLRLQRALLAEGFDPGPLDGIPGPRTQAALSAWNQRKLSYPTGIDVSKWQPTVNWFTVYAAGASFAYCKATQGTFKDPLFTSHWKGIKAAGLLRGAYHWFLPGLSLVAQADAVFAAVGVLGEGDLPVAIDIERDGKGPDGVQDTPDDIRATDLHAEELANLIRERTQKKPLVYSYSYYLDDRNIEVAKCPLWIADYRSGPPTLPPGWSTWSFHQYAGDSGRHPGVSGPCDLNRFRGTLPELHALAA